MENKNTYMNDKDIFKIRLQELHKISKFDMIDFKKNNPQLVEIIDLLIVGISRGTKKKFETLTITEKEEVLKNLFTPKEEEI